MKTLLILLAWSAASATAENIYIVPHSADGLHFVDVFREPDVGLQERVEHLHFTDKAQAQAAMVAAQRRYAGKVKPPRAFAPTEAHIMTTTDIWTVTEQWSEAWEHRYTQWMAENFTTDFFVRNRIESDCADVPVTMRWIFARIHGLPAGNHAAGSGRLITQSSFPADWARTPTAPEWQNDTRFLRALTYVTSNTFTGSVFYDLYPVHIDAHTIGPGAVWLFNGEHTYNVGSLDLSREDWLVFYSSTVPREVRELARTSFSGFDKPTVDYDGFRRHRWIVRDPNGDWRMLEGVDMIWYSEEQFQPEFMAGENDFAAAVYERLAGEVLSPNVRLRNLLGNVRGRFVARSTAVMQGFRTCFPNRCRPGTSLYDDWSTPHRDEQIALVIRKIDELLAREPSLVSDWQRARGDYLFWDWVDNTYRSHSFYLGELVDIWHEHRYSSDPNDAIAKRWGI